MHLFHNQKYENISNSSRNRIFFFMGMFDIADNIIKVRFNQVFCPVIINTMDFREIGNNGLLCIQDQCSKAEDWAKHITYCQIVSNESRFVVTDEGVRTENISDIIRTFTNSIGDCLIDTQANIPQQLCEYMTGLLDDGVLVDYDPNWIAFCTNIHQKFITAFHHYKIRHDVGQRGYSPDPFKDIVYLHFIFQIDNIYYHWFYPVAHADTYRG